MDAVVFHSALCRVPELEVIVREAVQSHGRLGVSPYFESDYVIDTLPMQAISQLPRLRLTTLSSVPQPLCYEPATSPATEALIGRQLIAPG